MIKLYLVSVLTLSFLALPMFGDYPILEELEEFSPERSEVLSSGKWGRIFGRKQKDNSTYSVLKDQDCIELPVQCDPNENNVSSNCCLPCDFQGFSTFIEYLLWQVQEQASDFVATPNEHSQLDPSYPIVEVLGRYRSSRFNWMSGFRVGLGYTMMRDAWQLRGQYTWFVTEGKQTFFAPPATTGEVIFPTFYTAIPPVAASNSVHFAYQMGDFLLARTFFLTKRIQSNFSFGVTGGYIKENFHITYEAVNNTYVQNDWSFRNGGVRTGIDSIWHIGKGFGLCSRFAFAPLLGKYKNSNRITTDAPSPGGVFSRTGPEVMNCKFRGIFLVPMTQIALGFNWVRSFTHRYISGINIALTGEFTHLPNLNQVFNRIGRQTIQSTPAGNQGPVFRDVSSVFLYGGNFRIGMDY